MKRIWITILMTGFLGLYCASASAGSYTDGTGGAVGTVTDNITSLVWQKCSAGQDSTDCSMLPTSHDWEAAISYCEDLPLGDFDDWRLPNIKELGSLVDYSKTNPSIDSLFANALFPNYWSSTTSASDTANAWAGALGIGGMSLGPKMNTNSVRCVRGQ